MLPAPPAAAVSRHLPRSLASSVATPSGRRLNFEPVGLAGRGTFAEVWQVRDRTTGQLLALKQLRADRKDQPAARRVLENEAEVAGKVSSQHVVRVFECDLAAELPYLALEWLPGRTLEARLAAEGRLFCRDALWIARQCAQGMHDILIAGFTHGDIKPANIFLCDTGVAKLIDLGFARADRFPETDLAEVPEHVVTGTPEYLAPESLVPGAADGVARDVYSLGVTLYRMLTGSLPFTGQTVGEVLRQQQQSLPPRLRALAPDVPRDVGEFVHRLLSKQPLRRGGGLSRLVRDLIGLELSLIADEFAAGKDDRVS